MLSTRFAGLPLFLPLPLSPLRVYIVNFSGQAYLEDFYKFCQEIGGTTAEVMGEILQVKPLP